MDRDEEFKALVQKLPLNISGIPKEQVAILNQLITKIIAPGYPNYTLFSALSCVKHAGKLYSQGGRNISAAFFDYYSETKKVDQLTLEALDELHTQIEPLLDKRAEEIAAYDGSDAGLQELKEATYLAAVQRTVNHYCDELMKRSEIVR